MLSRLTRTAVRGIHTRPALRNAPLSRRQLGIAVGGSVLVTYFAWRLTSPANRISMDADTPVAALKSGPSTPKLVAAPEKVQASSATDDLSKADSSADSEPKPSSGDASPETSAGGGGGAYNPETGEINWDCPCLGGMAHGPCGEEFREAFSCFIFSEQEPKGIDCVEKFKGMQTCFRAHPDVYGDDIMKDDDEEEEQEAPATAHAEQESPATPEASSEKAQEIPSSSFVADSTSPEEKPSVPPVH